MQKNAITEMTRKSDSESRIEVQPDTAVEYQRRICLAMNFISENLGEQLTLERIARSASFSQFHFHRIFKAVIGETVSEFTRRLRLEQAARQLTFNKTDSVTTIAIRLGFSSSQNFSKAFRKRFRMTPSEFRNSKSGNKVSKEENAAADSGHYHLGNILKVPESPQMNHPMTVTLEQIEEFRVAYVRKLGPYGKRSCQSAFTELGAWGGPKGLFNTGKTFGVYWDSPDITSAENCRTDACISLPPDFVVDGNVSEQLLGGGRYAVCNFHLESDDFKFAWEDAFAWLVGTKHMVDDKPCFERYIRSPLDPGSSKWIFDICIPVK